MNYFVKSEFLHIIFFLLAYSLILPGTASEYRILVSSVSEGEEQGQGRLFTAQPQWPLFSHYLGLCKQSWEANNPDYSKPDVPNVTLGAIVASSLHWGASEAVYSTAHRAQLCHQLRSATASLLLPNIPSTPLFSMKNVIQNKSFASKRDTPGCKLGRPSLPWYLPFPLL